MGSDLFQEYVDELIDCEARHTALISGGKNKNEKKDTSWFVNRVVIGPSQGRMETGRAVRSGPIADIHIGSHRR